MTDIDRTKIRQLDFTLLLILQGLLRYRRTVEVADELGLSQPAISHALRRLRDIFGDPLFLRRPHGLSPTRHALALAPIVESMLDQVHDAVGLARTFDPATSTRDFRIASPDLMGPLIVVPLLNRFEKEAPGARFALRTLVGEDAVSAVQQDQLDIAVGQFAVNPKGVDVSPLYDDEYVLLTRARHPTSGRAVTVKMLRDLSFVTLSGTGEFRGFTDDELEMHGVRRHIVATVPRFPTAVEMVRKTNAAVLSPRRLAEMYLAPFRLEIRSLPFRLRPFHVLLVARENLDAGRDWLIDVVRSVVQ